MKNAIEKRTKELIGRAATLARVFAWDFRSKMVLVTFHRIRDELEPWKGS